MTYWRPGGGPPAWGWILRSLCTCAVAGVLLMATPLSTALDQKTRPQDIQEIRRAIVFYAKRYTLDPALVRAVIKVESDFRPHVISKKGAVGLMQLTPETAAGLRIADLQDPVQNIRGGARRLHQLLNVYEGNLPLALAAYNAGVHRVKGGRMPRIRETRAYVGKVLRYYEAFRTAETR